MNYVFLIIVKGSSYPYPYAYSSVDHRVNIIKTVHRERCRFSEEELDIHLERETDTLARFASDRLTVSDDVFNDMYRETFAIMELLIFRKLEFGPTNDYGIVASASLLTLESFIAISYTIMKRESKRVSKHESSLETYCSGEECYNVGTKKCGKCQAVYYCSPECQKKHWKQQHKKECNHMEELMQTESIGHKTYSYVGGEWIEII